MVPHSSIRAKPNRYISTFWSEIAPKDWQTADKFIRHQLYSRPFWLDNPHLNQPAQPPARERGGQAQVSDNDYHTSRNRRLVDRKPGCASLKSRYNEPIRNETLPTCFAAGAFNPDGDHARIRGSSQPDHQSQEPRSSFISLTDIHSSVLKANSRPLALDGGAVISRGWRNIQERMEQITAKRLLRPQHRATPRITSPTAAVAKAYFWRCGLTRSRRRGHPQTAGAYRSAQRPVSAYRALQKSDVS